MRVAGAGSFAAPGRKYGPGKYTPPPPRPGSGRGPAGARESIFIVFIGGRANLKKVMKRIGLLVFGSGFNLKRVMKHHGLL